MMFYAIQKGRMSSVATAKVDWSKFLEKCTPAVRKTVTDLRGRHEELRRLITETRAAIPTISPDHLKYYADKLKDAPAEYRGVYEDARKGVEQFRITEVDIGDKLRELEAQREAKVRKKCLCRCLCVVE